MTLKVLMALDGVTDPREGEMNWDLRTREVTYRGAHTGMYLDCTGAPVRPTGEPVATPQRHAAVGQTYERCLRERGGSSV
ncbi:hypothetical protein [Rubrivirga sp. IMCC45206]|uniref:hypothetical protein n=1 Tax=Rubrivirga sp. IMCC45206 TaxID=3391614 RepID=UPI00398FFEF6